MKLLILGGTIFVGRHLVQIGLERGHEITLFNRGQHNPDIFPGVEKLRGDRDGDLTALEGRCWDAVIDTCGYVPRIVRASADLLADSVDHYTFISSISVYADLSQPGTDESGQVGQLEDESVEQVTGETYGPLKALCEAAAEGAMPGRVLNIRPGLIVGPYDPTDRYTYWPHRMTQGGEVLAPGNPEARTQVIDCRDLAAWTLDMIAAGQTGIYNATGPAYPPTMAGMLEICRLSTGPDAHLTWLDESFLLEHEVGPWIEMPLWLPGEENAGFGKVDVGKAVAAGLTFRPLAETTRDTAAWATARAQEYPEYEWRGGMKPEREAELLAAWHRRNA